MAAGETTMSDLLGAIRTLLQAQTTTGLPLWGVRQVKRGVLPPRYQLPTLAILPVSEEYTAYYSGRDARLERTVEVHVVARDLRGKQGMYDTEGLIDAARDLLRADYQLLDGSNVPRVLNVDCGPIYFGEAQIGEDLLQDAHFDVVYRCRDRLPALTLVSAVTDDPDGHDVADLVFDHLKAALGASFREYSLGDLGPRGLWPALLLQADSVESEPYPGRDLLQGGLTVTLLSPVYGASDQTLIGHLESLEAVKDALQDTPQWSGRCRSSQIDAITFTTAPHAKEGLLYQTEIAFSYTAKSNTTT